MASALGCDGLLSPGRLCAVCSSAGPARNHDRLQSQALPTPFPQCHRNLKQRGSSPSLEPCSHRRAGRMSQATWEQRGAPQVATDCLMRAGHLAGAPKDSDFLVKLSLHGGGTHPAHKFEAGGSPVSGHHGAHSEILSQKPRDGQGGTCL